MRQTMDRDLGWPLFVVGAVMMVVGLLGADTTGDADWVALLIGFGGALLVAAGLYIASRRRGPGGTPHTAP